MPGPGALRLRRRGWARTRPRGGSSNFSLLPTGRGGPSGREWQVGVRRAQRLSRSRAFKVASSLLPAGRPSKRRFRREAASGPSSTELPPEAETRRPRHAHCGWHHLEATLLRLAPCRTYPQPACVNLGCRHPLRRIIAAGDMPVGVSARDSPPGPLAAWGRGRLSVVLVVTRATPTAPIASQWRSGFWPS